MNGSFGFDELKRLLEIRVGLTADDVGDDPGRRFDEMDLDSLAFEEVQLALEDAYGFTITYADAQTIITLGDAIDYTNRRIGERA